MFKTALVSNIDCEKEIKIKFYIIEIFLHCGNILLIHLHSCDKKLLSQDNIRSPMWQQPLPLETKEEE